MKMILNLILLGGLLSACSSISVCRGRNEVPEFVVYPDSVLVQTNTGRANDFGIVSFEYTVNVSWEILRDYYEYIINCRIPSNDQDRVVCEGSATPYGEYSVYLNPSAMDTLNTTYTVEVFWDKLNCST